VLRPPAKARFAAHNPVLLHACIQMQARALRRSFLQIPRHQALPARVCHVQHALPLFYSSIHL